MIFSVELRSSVCIEVPYEMLLTDCCSWSVRLSSRRRPRDATMTLARRSSTLLLSTGWFRFTWGIVIHFAWFRLSRLFLDGVFPPGSQGQRLGLSSRRSTSSISCFPDVITAALRTSYLLVCSVRHLTRDLQVQFTHLTVSLLLL